MDRRSFLGVCGAALVCRPSMAATSSEVNQQRLTEIASRAVSAGLLDSNSASAGLTNPEQQILLLATITSAAVERGVDQEAMRGLSLDSGALLSELHRAIPRRRIPGRRLRFEHAAPVYYQQFQACEPIRERSTEIERWADFFVRSRNRDQYVAVDKITAVPWFVVAILHFREASANFQGHLHNGDPLIRITRQVPSGRPKKLVPWPPRPWEPVSA